MTRAQEYAAEIIRAIPHVPDGSLRFWGVWFGRPYDNHHKLVGCSAEENVLKLNFHEGETLSVWEPKRLSLSARRFQIGGARCVRWEWFLYGEPKTPENLRFEEYRRSIFNISVSGSADSPKPSFKPSILEPAVKIVAR